MTDIPLKLNTGATIPALGLGMSSALLVSLVNLA